MSGNKIGCCFPCLNRPISNGITITSGRFNDVVTPLELKNVDCDWLQKDNENAHHTDEFANTTMVLRRGQSFKVKMAFKRPFHKKADKVSLNLVLGSIHGAQTKIICSLVESFDEKKWGMMIKDENNDGLVVTFEVFIPATASIGRYKTTLVMTSELESGETKTTKDQEPEFIVLFNPWSEADVVYMSDADKRQEYCLNDIGIIYRGSSSWPSPKKWNFGQFERDILECSLSLLDKDKRVKKNPSKWIHKRSDPVWVSRIMSAMVNSSDDEGVLVGNWSNDYSGGASPTKWNGSVEILQQYYKTNKPVCFGQCWVFSGLVTTVLRCLGIPTRSVTNFVSAHDTESSMTIDNFVDVNGDEVELGNDSVWNYHVWNECWMKRNDLPSGYDGWQAVDATPQEVSLGLFQTGPAPLTAIKNGEVYMGFETGFVFAEVNADRVNWVVEKEDGNYAVSELGSRYTKSVGKNISTKAVGKNERLDVTDLYKAPEGSEEERKAFRKAYAFGSVPEYQKGFLSVEEEGKGISLDFKQSSEILKNGDGFSISVEMKNETDQGITVDLSAVLHSTLYTGKKKNFIKRQRFSAIPIGAHATLSKEIALTYSDYGKKIVDQNSMRLQAVVKVIETGKMFSDVFEFRLENKDSIDIEVDNNLKVGSQCDVLVNFTNPLPTALTNVIFTLEGPGLAEPAVKKFGKTVAAGGTAQAKFSICPKKRGDKTILVDIDTKEVKDLKSFVDVVVA